jgi:phosphoglycolate phosphatase-like HAD superfamily hydrolase
MEKLVIFDLDGTVLDTVEDIADCMNMAITELGYQPRSYPEYRKVIGNDAPNFVRKLLGDMPFEKLMYIWNYYIPFVEKYGTNKTKVFKGIKEGVDKAKEYKDAILQLNELLEPYKDELLKTEYASKLYDEASLITIASMRNKGFNIVYVHLDEDIKSTISAEDYKKYRNIIQFMWLMDNPLS